MCTDTTTPRATPAGTQPPRPSPRPTPRPTPNPTPDPTPQPTSAPVAQRILTDQPTRFVYTPQPTNPPTPDPTTRPTPNPTPDPTPQPTPAPVVEARLLTPQPTRFLYTPQPTNPPTPEPTPGPTANPTPEPTPEPTPNPTERPTPSPFKPPEVPEFEEACLDDPCKLNFREDTNASCDPNVEKLIAIDSWCGVKWDPWCVTAYSDCFETSNCPPEDIDKIVEEGGVNRTRIDCPTDEAVLAFKEVTPIAKPAVENPTCPPAFPGSGSSCDATNLQCYYSYGSIVWVCNCGTDPVAFMCKPAPAA